MRDAEKNTWITLLDTMRRATIWIAGATLVAHTCNGYVAMLRRHPTACSIHKSPIFRATRRSVSVNATANEDANEKNEEKNERSLNVTNSPWSRFFGSLTKPVQKAVVRDYPSFPLGTDDSSSNVAPTKRQQSASKKSQPSDAITGFWQQLKLPQLKHFPFFASNDDDVDATKRPPDSPSRKETVTTERRPSDDTSAVVRFFQQLMKAKEADEEYPSFPAGSDADSLSKDKLELETRKPIPPQKHHDTSVVVRFFRRLLNRNATTSTIPPSASSTSTNTTTLVDPSVIVRFFQRLMNRNATTSATPSTNTFSSVATIDPNTTTLVVPREPFISGAIIYEQPVGPRWAIPANTTDLSGKWKPIVTAKFKEQYDEYLKNCSQSFAFRNLCLTFVGLTREEIKQNGSSLQIRGTSPVGVWERTLVSSGSDLCNADYEPFNVTFLDPDRDTVNVEAWWADNGTVHKSWLRGKPRVCGGEFESTRYLEPENDVLVCESVFHPNGATKGFQPAYVKWRFEREK